MFRRMKLSHRVAALAVAALLLPGLRAVAQTSSSSSGDEFEQDDSKPKPKSDKSAEGSAKPEAPPEPAVTIAPAAPAAAETASDNPYVPFAPPPGPLGIEVPNASVHFGFLAQPEFEQASGPDAALTSKQIFLRRIRFMFGGTLYKYFEFFFDTDYPNLFKEDLTDTSAGPYKNAPGLNIQDAYITFKPAGDLIKVDAGFMLPPGPHNGLESAAKLYTNDYFVNTFRRSILNNLDPFLSSSQSPAGRDLGLQLRGLVFGGHLEARAGVFQGVRANEIPAGIGIAATVGAVNIFRIAARLQVNVLDAETGYFYAGTYHGTKKILSFGGFYDFESQYHYFGGDAFLDLPLGPGIVTVQADFVQWKGESADTAVPNAPTLPKETALMVQAGYLIAPIMLSPFVTYEHLVSDATVPNPDPTMSNMLPDPNNPSENRYGAGLAFWPYGHNVNLKASFQHVVRNPAPHAFNQFDLQWQLYFF